MFKCLHIGRNWPWKECVCHRNWQVPHIRAFASLQPPPPVPSSEEPAYTGDLYLSKASSSLVLGRPILTKEETVPLSGSSQPDDSPPCLLEYFMVLNSVVHIIYLIDLPKAPKASIQVYGCLCALRTEAAEHSRPELKILGFRICLTTWQGWEDWEDPRCSKLSLVSKEARPTVKMSRELLPGDRSRTQIS